MNDRGQICGTGIYQDSLRAFVLTPRRGGRDASYTAVEPRSPEYSGRAAMLRPCALHGIRSQAFVGGHYLFGPCARLNQKVLTGGMKTQIEIVPSRLLPGWASADR